MRAVAVLTVFAHHLFHWPPGGFVGVDVFFVLSGFFITGLLIRERTTTSQVSFRNFYTRRAKRILPSALLVLTVTVIGAYALFPAVRARETLLDALYAAVFASNFRFEAVGADYFQQGEPPSPLQHYWSLSIEEQFYFVWPALLAGIFLATRRLRRRGVGWAGHWGLMGTMALIVAASFGWAVYLSARNPDSAYFSTFTRAWELGIGALLATAAPWLLRIPEGIRPALAYAGLAGVAASLFLINPTVQFPAPWVALPVLSTALVVAAFHGSPARSVSLLTNPVAQWFGDRSYTLYLWHWPVIVLLETVLRRGPVFNLVAIALALGLTAVTYRHYENPIRESSWLLDVPRKSGRAELWMNPRNWAVVGGAAATAIVVSIVLMTYDSEISEAQKSAAAATQRDKTSNPDSSLTEKVDPCFGAPAMVTAGCVLIKPGEPVVPSIDRLRDDTQGAYECHRREGEKFQNSCTYGYMGEDAKRIAVVGDSHAAAILPAIWNMAEKNKWQIRTFTGWGCRFDSLPGGDCPLQEISKKLLERPYDLVIFTGSRKYGGDPGAFAQMTAPLVAAGSRIAVLEDVPDVSEDAMGCLTRNNVAGKDLGECGTPRSEALAYPDTLVAAAAYVPGASVIDLTRFYCNDQRCPSVIGNVVVYLDKGAHVTATWASSLGQAMAEGIKNALHPR